MKDTSVRESPKHGKRLPFGLNDPQQGLWPLGLQWDMVYGSNLRVHLVLKVGMRYGSVSSEPLWHFGR